jgi:hypothetical protein
MRTPPSLSILTVLRFLLDVGDFKYTQWETACCPRSVTIFHDGKMYLNPVVNPQNGIVPVH